MPRKSRTPPPPRRVQAPKTRQAERTPDERRMWRILIAISALGFVGLAVVIGILVFGGGSKAATIEDAGCILQTFPGQGQSHVEQLPKGFEYNSDPPTSGPHNATPAPWDAYDQPVEPLRFVHNLEHGGVVILYGDEVADADVEALIDWYRDDPNGIVLAPYPQNGKQISLGAWTADVDPAGGEATNQRGVLAKCPGFRKGAFDAFVDEYGFKGPERFPRDQLTPGS